MPIKVHLSITRPGAFGGTVTKSLCSRMRLMSDGMNLTGERDAVTCKFCLAILANRAE